MKTNIKYQLLSCFAVLTCFILHSGCNENATNPAGNQTPEFEAAEIRNIVWTLASYEKAGQEMDILEYPPFHLIYDEEQFFGDDGCNWFKGLYEARNDSIFPGDISQTLRLCIIPSFPVTHLAEPYRINIVGSQLRILRGEAIYTYKSDFTDSVKNSPLTLLQNFILNASTDPEFPEIQAQQLIPTLIFEENREFKIAWYCVADNTFGCDEISGIFGLGEGNKILFYQREASYHGQGPGENFMQRILNSSAYSIEPGTPKGGKLILFNEDNGTRFEFEAPVRSDS